MRIAYLMHGMGWGGAAGSLFLLLESLSGYNYHKTLFTTVDRNIPIRQKFIQLVDKYEELRLPHMYNDAAGGRTDENKFSEIINNNYDYVVKKLIDNDIDVLHINTSILPHIVKYVKEHTSIKVVTHVREMIPKYDNGIVQSYMLEVIESCSDYIICISDNEREQFNRKENISTIPNPFNFDVLQKTRSNFRKKYNISNDTIIVGMGGQFSKSKGHMDFLKVAKLIKSNKGFTNDKILFVCMGVNYSPYWKVMAKIALRKFDYGYLFKKFLKENKLNELVVVLPMMYTKQFYEVLSEIDIYVNPSLAGDPWGRVIIEAMAFKKPIIATGSSDFFVKPNVNGYLVKPGDVHSMADYVIELASDSPKRMIFSENSFKIVKDMCDLNSYGCKIKKIYESL